MTVLQKIKKIIIDRNKAYMRLDGEKATLLTNEIEILLPKIVKDEDRKLVLKWLNEKNEKQHHILLEALKSYKLRMNSSVMSINNQSYDLSEWCTITQYAKIFNFKSTQAITNQIKRGKIPTQHVLIIPELDLKLIKLP